jgi:regulator of protease activity HflC (stomatin/prohibitin superfamily)
VAPVSPAGAQEGRPVKGIGTPVFLENGDMTSYKPSQRIRNFFDTTRLIKFGVGAAVCGLLALSSIYKVDSNEQAVVDRGGAITRIESAGYHVKLPIVEGVTFYRTDLQALIPIAQSVATIDNQELTNVKIVVQYRLPANKIQYFHTDMRDYEQRLQSMALDRFKAVLGKVNTTDIAQKRGDVRDQIYSSIKAEAMRLYNIEVVDFQIPDFDYSPAFRKALDDNMTKKAEVEREIQEKARATVEAEKDRIVAEGKANAAIEAARGGAESRRIAAEADARATEVNGAASAKVTEMNGMAEASAVSAVQKAIAQNPLYIEYLKALAQGKWEGGTPNTLIVSGSGAGNGSSGTSVLNVLDISGSGGKVVPVPAPSGAKP